MGMQDVKRVPSMISIASLKSDYSPVRRGPACVDSEPDQVCRISSNLSVGPLEEIEQSFGRILSIKTNYSPRSRTQTADDFDAIAAIGSSCTGLGIVQQTVTPMMQLVQAPMMVLSLCTAQVDSQAPAPSKPPGNFSQPTGPPGVFLKPAEEAMTEEQDLMDQQRMLQEQRRRLLSMSTARCGTSSWATPASQKPLCAWTQDWERRNGDARQRSQTEIKAHERTTLILRNLPEGFSRDMVADFLNSQGLENKFNFIYVPVKFSVMATIGYAFVNFVSAEAAEDCLQRLDDFSDWTTPCEKTLNVFWSEKDQGLRTIIDRHRNSPVMHESVKDEFKPAIYVNGVRAAFPPPTKHIKPPREQRYNRGDPDVAGFETEC